MAKSTTKNSSSKKKEKQASAPPSSSQQKPTIVSDSDDDSSSEDDEDSSIGNNNSDDEDENNIKKVSATDKGKWKATDPANVKYKPPPGLKVVSGLTGAAGIDWDSIAKDSQLELWAVRVPAGVQSKHLEKIVIQLPPDENFLDDQPAKLGSFTAKKVPYDVHRVGSGGGEEMRALVPLLPRKDGNLVPAPRTVSQNILITRSLPGPLGTAASTLPGAPKHSTLISSQPSPVPGGVLSAEELLDPSTTSAQEKLKTKQRDQPAGLRMRLQLGGMGAVGGKGKFKNEGVVLPEVTELLFPAVQSESEEMVGVEALPETEQSKEVVEEEVAIEQEQGSPKKEKREKKDKKKRRESKGGEEAEGEDESPKKKKRRKSEA
ncbi:hypothetical protein T439DRAFT_322803 [Meredithblackwellia eburnea MCA 4105]